MSYTLHFLLSLAINSNEIACYRKVLKKHKIHSTEHTIASIDTFVNNLCHSCIVDIDASFIVSGSVYLVSAYCEVLY